MRSSAGDFYWGLAAHGSKPLWSADLIQLLQGKDRRKRPDRFYIGKKIIDMKVVLSLCVGHWKHCPSWLPNLLTCLVFSSFLYLISIMFALTKFLNSQPRIKWLHQSQWLIFKWHQQTVQPLFRYQCNIEINKASFPKKVKPPSISFRFKLFLASSSLHLTSLKVWAAVW